MRGKGWCSHLDFFYQCELWLQNVPPASFGQLRNMDSPSEYLIYSHSTLLGIHGGAATFLMLSLQIRHTGSGQVRNASEENKECQCETLSRE